MTTIKTARWSTLAIAVAAATSVSALTAQEFQKVDAAIKVTERHTTQVGEKHKMTIEEFAAAHESTRYTIEFVEPAVAVYKGGIAGFEATSAKATGAERLDVKSHKVQTYAQYLKKRQQTVLAEVSQRIPNLKVQSQLALTLNGAIVEYQGDDLKEKLRGIPGIKAVHKSYLVHTTMDASNDLINSPEVWQMLGGQDAAGKGVNVAVIDSGIDFAHPMFADNGHDPIATPVTDDYCALNAGVCNDKIAVARYYPAPVSVHPSEFIDSPQDYNGHGSHVAGTSAGNPVSTTFNGVALNFSGVAPGANLMIYKALYHTVSGNGSGDSASLEQALEDAAADGADVINNSWGGGAGGSPANSPYTTIMKSLDEMGVVTVTSAGNSGPGEQTVGCPGCIEETITVASTRTGRLFGNPVAVDGFDDLLAVEGSGNFTIDAAITAPVMPALEVDSANFEGCSAFPADAFAGHIAMISRGTCSFEVKANNAQAAGATALIVYNNAGAAAGMTMGAATLPSVMIGQADGDAILAAWTTGLSATINPAQTVIDEDNVDVLSAFSSRGPNGDPNMLKPEIAAPGHDILSAAPGQGYRAISGTSMASPHVAGAAALLLAHNPDLLPQQVKSILMTSSVDGVLKEDGVTPADPFDVGAGRLELPSAFNTGITFDVASFANPMCLNVCNFTRQITNLDDAAGEWHVTVELANPNVPVTYPETVTIEANGSVEFTLEVVGRYTDEEWQFGTVTFTDASGNFADARLPIAVYTAMSENPGAMSSGVTAGEVAANSPMTLTMLSALGNTGEDVTITAQFPSDENFVVDEDSVVVTETLSSTISSTLDSTARTYTWTGTQTDNPAVLTLQPATTFPWAGFDFDMIGGATYAECASGCDEAGFTIDLTGAASWEYEGKQYSKFTFWENGIVQLGDPTVATTWQIQGLPTTPEPNNVLAPLWVDFETEAGEGELRYDIVYDGVDNWLIIEWYRVQEWGDTTGATHTFNIWFRLGGDDAYFNYIDVNQTTNIYGVIGLENVDGTIGGMAYAAGSGYYPADGEAFEIGLTKGELASVKIDLDATVTTFGDVSSATGSGAHSRAMSIDLTDAVGAPQRDLLTLLNITSGTVSYDAILPMLIKPDGTMTVEVTAQPAHGTVSLDGMIATYTPEAGYVGSDSFSYRVVDAAGAMSTANTVSVTVTNTAPTVTATAPETAENGDTVVLDASSAADAEGDALTYSWVQTAGPEIELSGADAAQASFTAPLFEEDDTEFGFTVTVSDGLESVTSDVVMTVLADPNTAPVININAPSSVSADTIVRLDASGTTDAEGDTLTFNWQFAGGATVSLTNANTAVATFTAPRVFEQAEANFVVTVSDGRATSQQMVTVTFEPEEKSSGSMPWLFTLLALPLVWLRRRKG